MGDLSLPHFIDLLGWGEYLFINFLCFPFSSQDDCTSSFDFMLEISLLILSIVHQIEGLDAAITLLMVAQGEDSIEYLALQGLTGLPWVAPSICSLYKIVEPGWVHRSDNTLAPFGWSRVGWLSNLWCEIKLIPLTQISPPPLMIPDKATPWNLTTGVGGAPPHSGSL